MATTMAGIKMRTTRIMLLCLLMLGMSLAITQSVYAYGSETSTTGSVITVNPKARGIKLRGPLTIYLPYEETDAYYTDDCWDSGVPFKSTMYIFIRLEKRSEEGETLYPFSGALPDICVADIDQQQAAIREYIRTVVIPNIFPNNPDAFYEVKKVDDMVMDNSNIIDINGNPVIQPPFIMMDIEIAVRNRH